MTKKEETLTKDRYIIRLAVDKFRTDENPFPKTEMLEVEKFFDIGKEPLLKDIIEICEENLGISANIRSLNPVVLVPILGTDNKGIMKVVFTGRTKDVTYRRVVKLF